MRAFLCVTLLAATPVLATPYDGGVFRPNYSWAEGWDCQSIGMDGGGPSRSRAINSWGG